MACGEKSHLSLEALAVCRVKGSPPCEGLGELKRPVRCAWPLALLTQPRLCPANVHYLAITPAYTKQRANGGLAQTRRR